MVTSQIQFSDWPRPFSPTASEFEYEVSHLPDDSYPHSDVGWNTSVVGFTLNLQRESFKYVALYFLPTGMFVLISSMSFLIPPTAYPARCGLLITTLLVLVTMFPNVLSNTPSEPKGLTALAIWILGSLILVFI